ncbi:MAG: hypothetical protein ABI945_01815 [Nitrospirales bacterium]
MTMVNSKTIVNAYQPGSRHMMGDGLKCLSWQAGLVGECNRKDFGLHRFAAAFMNNPG